MSKVSVTVTTTTGRVFTSGEKECTQSGYIQLSELVSQLKNLNSLSLVVDGEDVYFNPDHIESVRVKYE